MIEKLIEEYYKLVEAKELLDYLIITCNIQNHLSPNANIKVDKYYGFNNDE